jgi:hypothetical protein
MNKEDFPEIYRFLSVYRQQQAKQYKDYMQTNHRTNATSRINSQASGEQAIRNNNYIVGSLDSAGTLSFAANPTLHTSAQYARTECRRLAALSPGKTYVFVMLAGAERTVPQPTLVSI